MNWKDRFRALPKNTKNLLVVGVLLALVAALPLFIWGIVTQKFLITQKAASGEPSVCVPQGMEIVVTPPGGSGTCHDIQTAIDAVTGDGYTVLIKPGFYEASSTINISGKSNIHVRGDSTSWYGGESTVLNFIPGSGWGFLVSNSSGGISYLRMQGQTPNGMLSIQNSNNFNIGQSYLNAQTSHALDIQRSTQIYISNVEIQSSAGALEVGSSGTVYIADSRIHDSDNAISVVDSTNINILYNLIYSNRERAVRLQDVNGLTAEHNTVVNNGAGSDYSPAVEVKGYMSGLFQISKNIIAFNQNGGINFSGTSSNLTGYFSNNDLYQNDSMGAPDNINYVGVPNQTGLNGNISQDPLINFSNNYYCLRPGSPALYGNLNISEFMGRTGPCGTEPTPVVPPVTPPPTSPSAYCPGPNGSQCDLSTCPVCTGPTCPLVYCIPKKGICQNHVCLPIATPIPTSTPSASCNATCGSNYNCGSGLVCSKGFCRNPACTSDNDCICNITHKSFGITFRFAGVTDGSANGAGVTARFVSPNWGGISYITPPIISQYIGSGVYSLRFSLQSTSLPAAGNYAIVLKGEKHEQVKYCQSFGQTAHCTASTVGQISIPDTSSLISLNFTGIPLPPGDTYTQDGIINYIDYDRIHTRLSKLSSSLTEEDKLIADLNYDGRVDNLDMFLFRKTLETKYDEF